LDVPFLGRKLHIIGGNGMIAKWLDNMGEWENCNTLYPHLVPRFFSNFEQKH
jgi:hypothetical protein